MPGRANRGACGILVPIPAPYRWESKMPDADKAMIEAVLRALMDSAGEVLDTGEDWYSDECGAACDALEADLRRAYDLIGGDDARA